MALGKAKTFCFNIIEIYYQLLLAMVVLKV